jgi:hypothetical protein
MRRFTSLTTAFSKKVENHAAAVALYFMEARVADRAWSDEEIVGLPSKQRENRMSLAPRSVAIPAILLTLIGFIAGGIVGFRDYVPGRVSPMWPMWLIWLSMLGISIPFVTRWRRRRRAN